jgi:hypothetical protein
MSGLGVEAVHRATAQAIRRVAALPRDLDDEIGIDVGRPGLRPSPFDRSSAWRGLGASTLARDRQRSGHSLMHSGYRRRAESVLTRDASRRTGVRAKAAFHCRREIGFGTQS